TLGRTVVKLISSLATSASPPSVAPTTYTLHPQIMTWCATSRPPALTSSPPSTAVALSFRRTITASVPPALSPLAGNSLDLVEPATYNLFPHGPAAASVRATL